MTPRANPQSVDAWEQVRDGLRRGVCQDFAHFMIGCLRTLGIPARYMSGYIRTTPPVRVTVSPLPA